MNFLVKICLSFLALTSLVGAQDARRRRTLPQSETPFNMTPAPGMAASVIAGAATIQGTNPLPSVPNGKSAVYMRARYGKEGAVIAKGLQWRVFLSAPNEDNSFTLIGESNEPAPIFALDGGQYIVHVSFGLASQTRRLDVGFEAQREMFQMNAGAMVLRASVGDKNLPSEKLLFDIYSGSQFDGREPQILMKGAKQGQLLILPEASYHIVSLYGDANATVRADTKVNTGKVTDATLHHRAAEVSFRLINNQGQLVTNAAWTIMNLGGDVLKESIGVMQPLALLEGEYLALVRVDGKTLNQKFLVDIGKNATIDVYQKQ